MPYLLSLHYYEKKRKQKRHIISGSGNSGRKIKLVKQKISQLEFLVGVEKTSYQDENIQNIAYTKRLRTKKCS
ncbi:hypothetical protein YC2023_117003 [Brassica napus]